MCWIAPRDAGVGDYGEAIVDAIKDASLIVILLSAAANESVHVKNGSNGQRASTSPSSRFGLKK